jgi:hypothetical protein
VRQGWRQVERGATRRREVGGGAGPTGRRWAAGTRPATSRSGARSVSRQRRAGITDGWPPCYSGGSTVESWTLTRGPHSTVRAVAELDSKKKFQTRLKSNSSNGFKFLHKFDCLKQDLLSLQKFETKYGFEYLGEVNNFLHSSLSRFEMVWE